MIKISLTALNPDNKIVVAQDVNRDDGPFRCTFCHNFMIIRKGIVKIHHFAHTKDSTCPYATGETMEHEMAKLNLYNLAKSKGIEAKMEDVLSEHVRADLTLMTPEGKIAIEFQKSGMTDEYANLRMDHYKETGISVIWVMLKNDNYPEHGEELTVTTKDMMFYNIYGNILYTLYKDDLIDVWRLDPVIRNNKTLSMTKKYIHLARLSLLDFKSFTYDKFVIPKQCITCAIDIRFLPLGGRMGLNLDGSGSEGIYYGYTTAYIKTDAGETPWDRIESAYYYNNDIWCDCYIPDELVDEYREWEKSQQEIKEYKHIQYLIKHNPKEARCQYLRAFGKKGGKGSIHVATIYDGKKWDGNFIKALKKGDSVYITTNNGRQKYTYQGHKSDGIKVGNSPDIFDIISWDSVDDIYYMEDELKDKHITVSEEKLKDFFEELKSPSHNTEQKPLDNHKNSEDNAPIINNSNKMSNSMELPDKKIIDASKYMKVYCNRLSLYASDSKLINEGKKISIHRGDILYVINGSQIIEYKYEGNVGKDILLSRDSDHTSISWNEIAHNAYYMPEVPECADTINEDKPNKFFE